MSNDPPTTDTPTSDVLSSWKEIAAFLGRGVRTAQRWESELQMPVYRPAGKLPGAVMAMKPEIEQWVRSRAAGKRSHQLIAGRALELAAAQAPPDLEFRHELLASSRSLRADVARNRALLMKSIATLWRTLH